MSKRIPDILTASRCIDAICDALQRRESPLTAADLREAIHLIVQSRERKAFEAAQDGWQDWQWPTTFEQYKESAEYLKEGGE